MGIEFIFRVMKMFWNHAVVDTLNQYLVYTVNILYVNILKISGIIHFKMVKIMSL